MLCCIVRVLTSGFGTSSVGHGQSSGCVGDALVVLANFIGDGSTSIALVSFSVTSLEAGARIGSTSSSSWAVGVLGVRASELIHKVGNDTMKVNAIIISTVGQINKVSASNGHLGGVKFSLERSHGGSEGSDRHGR